MAYSDSVGSYKKVAATPQAPAHSPAEAETRISPRTYLAVAVLAVGVILAALDLTVVAAILPKVMLDLEIPITSVDQAAWIVSAYLLAYTVTMPFLGRVSDVFGRRTVFFLALAIFIIGSVLAAQANDLSAMIVARAVQALGGGAMVPVSMAMISDLFPPSKRGAALGLIGAADTAGWVIGPLYGALLLNLNWHPNLGFINVVSSWRLIFWINVPLGLLSALLLFIVLPKTGGKTDLSSGSLARRLRHIDVLGALFLSLALVGLNLALGGGGESAIFTAGSSTSTDNPFGTTNPFAQYTIPLLIGAAIALALFVITEWRVRVPLLDPRMFGNRTFSVANLTNLIVGGALMVGMVGVPLFVNATYRNDSADQIALQSALALAPLTLAMAVGAIIGGFITDRLGFRWTTFGGLLLAAGGFFIMSTWTSKMGSDVMQLAPGACLAGVGFGLVIAPLGTAVINSAQPSNAGVAAGLVLIMRLIGMTVGLSLMTTWALHQYTEATKNISLLNASSADLVEPLVRVIADLFLYAGVACLIAIVPALGLASRKEATNTNSREFGRLL